MSPPVCFGHIASYALPFAGGPWGSATPQPPKLDDGGIGFEVTAAAVQCDESIGKAWTAQDGTSWNWRAYWAARRRAASIPAALARADCSATAAAANCRSMAACSRMNAARLERLPIPRSACRRLGVNRMPPSPASRTNSQGSGEADFTGSGGACSNKPAVAVAEVHVSLMAHREGRGVVLRGPNQSRRERMVGFEVIVRLGPPSGPPQRGICPTVALRSREHGRESGLIAHERSPRTPALIRAERPPGQRGGMPFEDGGGLVHADEPFIGQAFDNGVKRRMW